MTGSAPRSRAKFFYRFIASIVLFTFSFWSVFPPSVMAQVMPGLLNLPAPGTMVTATEAFAAPMIYGLSVDPVNPLKFEFYVHKGDKELSTPDLRQEAQKLIKYFLATLTTPEDELWVNLSPNEADRIISEKFGVTEMGRDMLAQDYLLKQLTASLTYPEKELGKKFWKRVYAQAKERFGTTDVPLDNFHKVWIVPARAKVLEKDGHVFVLEARLRVMMEEDYFALQNNRAPDPQNPRSPEGILTGEQGNRGTGELTKLQTEIMREIILPEIEREVNEGETFAPLRQIFHSMILATWYKKNLRETLLGKIYVDQHKTAGVDVEDKQIKQKIYERYLETLKRGAFNYIKEEYDLRTQEIVPRQYFSGGGQFSGRFSVDDLLETEHRATPAEVRWLDQQSADGFRAPTLLVETDGSEDRAAQLEASNQPKGADTAMLAFGPEMVQAGLTSTAIGVALGGLIVVTVLIWQREIRNADQLKKEHPNVWRNFARQTMRYGLGRHAQAVLFQKAMDQHRRSGGFVVVQKKNPKGADVFDVLPKGASKGGDSAMLGGMRPWLTRSTACLGFGVFSLLVSPASPQSGFAQSIDQPVSAVVESQEKDSPEKLVLDIRGFTSEERAHFNLVLQIIRNFDPESLKILTDLNQSGRLSIAIASEESMKQLVMVAKSMDPLAKQEAAIHIGGVTIYEWQKAVNGKPSYAVFINERANAVEFLMFTLHELAGHVAQDERYAYGWTLSYQEKEEKAHSVEKSMLETLVDNREKIVEGAATAGMPFSDIYWLEDALHTARMNRRVSDIQVTLDRWSRVNDQSDGTGQAQLPERNQEILGLQESYDFIDFHALTKIENPALAAEIARELKRGLDMVERISTFFLRSGLSDKRLFVAFDKDTQEITIEFPEGGSDRHVIPAAQLPDLWKYMIHDNIYFGGLPDQVKELFMEIDHAPRNEAIRGKIKRRIEALKSQNWKELRDGAPSESTELGIEASFVADRHFEQYRDEYLGLVPEETLTEPMRMFMDALINSGTVTASVIPARHSWKGPAIMIAVMGAGAVGFGLWRHVRNKEQNDSDENSDSAMLADLREKILDVSDAGQLDRVTAAKKYLADPSSRTNKSGNSDMLFDLWDQTAYEDENHVLHQLAVQTKAMEILALFLKNDAVEISSLGELLRYRIPDVNRLERMVRQERFETGPSERRTAGIHRKVAARELLDLLKEKRVIHREGVRGMIDQRKLEELLHIEKGRATAEALVEQFARGEIVPGAIYDQRIVYEMLMSCVRHYFQFPPFQAADLVFEQRAMQVLTKVTDPGLIDRDVFAEALTQVNVQLEQRGRPDFITTLSFREEREPARERGQKTVVNMKSGAAHLLEALERQKLIAPVKGQGPDSAMLATLQEQQDRTFVPPGVDADIFKGKTIGITGGSGYISAPLIQRYLDAGASQVVIMDNQIRNREEISQLEGVVIEDVDLADTKTLREIFQRHHFDHITHLAADIEAGVSMKRPAFYHWNNVLNTRRLLGVMKEFDIKGITFASSAGVYEGKAEPLDEDVNVNPQNVYGATKRMMEKMMRDFSKKNGIRFAALRFFNVAGAFEWEIDGKKVILGENHRGQETHIIPGIFEVLQGKRPYFMMFGGDYATRDGSNVRDYIHVLDLANAIVRAAAWTMVGGQQEDLILNLGTKKGTSNFEILEEVQKVTGKKFHRLQGRELEIMKGYVKEKKNAEVKQFADQMKEKYQVDAIYFVADRRSGDADSLTANPERAKEKLGWEAVHSDVNTVIGDAWKYHSQEQIANTPLAEAEEINIESTETAYLRDLVDEISGDSELSKDVQFEELFRVFIDSLYDAKFDATDRPHQLPIYNSARDILAKQQPVLQSVLEDAAFIKLLKDQPLAATQRGGALAQVRAELLDMLQEAEESDDLQAFIESFGSDAAMLGQALAGLAFIVAVAVPTILAIRNWKLKYTQKLRTGYFDLWESFQRQVEPYQLGAVARAELFNRAVRVWKDKGSFEVIERRNDSAGGPVLDVVSREEARGMENKDPAMLSGVFQKTILAPDRVTLAITVKDPEGLHMRPAGEIVRTAQAFDCEGTIKNGDVKAEITSIMQVSMLVALQGSVLIFDIHGERANDSVAKFAEILGWTPAEIKEAMPSEEQPSHESDRAMLAEMGEFVWMAPIWVGLGLMTTLALAPHAHLLTQAMRGSRERKEYPWLWDTFEKRLAQHPDSPVAGVHKIALFHQAVHLYRHGYNFILMEKPRALHPLRFELCVLKGDRLQSQWISMRELLGDAWPAHVYEEVERQLAPFNVGVTPQEKGQLYEQAFQIARAGMKFEIKLKRGSIPLAVEIVAVNPLTKEIISSGADRAMLAERTIRKIAEQVVGKNIVLSAGYTPERWNMFPYRWSEGDSIVGEPTHFSTIPLGVIELLQEAKGPDESFDESPRVALSWLSYEPADEMEMAGRGYELLTQGQFIKFLRALSDSEDGEVRSFIVKGFLPALQAQMQGVELELDSATQTVFVQRHVAEDEDGDDIASQIKEVRGLTSTHALRKRLKDSDLDPMVKREIRLQIRRLSRTWGPERQAAALAIKSVPNAPGGIDFNPALFDLEIKRDDKGVPLPIEMQSVPELNNIQGFVPVILEITPATNLPMLLGLMDDGEATEGLSLGSSDGTAIIEREKIFDRKRAAARRS